MYSETYQTYSDALEESGLGLGAAEAHGLLVAHACLSKDKAGWQAALLAAQKPLPLLDDLYETTWQALDSEDLGFELLVLDGEHGVVDYARSLALWCHGFVSGFSLMNIPNSSLGDDIKEALLDLGEISQLDLDAVSQDNESETMLVELEEYIRTIAMLVFASCQHRKTLH